MLQASTIDGRRKGACLFCQEYFMDLYLLAELKTISLKVTTVDMQKPPPDFRTNFQATPPPILIDNGDAILENEKIERHIMKNIPGGHNLFVQDKEVATLVENLFSVCISVDSLLLRREISTFSSRPVAKRTYFYCRNWNCYCWTQRIKIKIQNLRPWWHTCAKLTNT